MPTIAKLLDTRSKKEQEERVQQLLQMAQVPVMSVMVLLDPRVGRLDIRAAGLDNANVADIKYVLRSAIDELTVKEAEAKKEQSAEAIPQGDLTPPGEFIQVEDAPDELDHNPT